MFAQTKQAAVKYDVPVREHAIMLSEQGYFPNKISLFEGEKLRIFFSSVKDRPSCLMMREKNIFLTAKSGEIVEGEILFDRAGSYTFYCPAEKYTGTIAVLPRARNISDKGRSVASEQKPSEEKNIVQVWIPREGP